MCRAVFVLHDIEEISVELVAEILSRSVPAVKVCLLRARLQLRDVLTSELMR
jgi:DNA-directed RNA polymerase specialized sigma24 family protein